MEEGKIRQSVLIKGVFLRKVQGYLKSRGRSVDPDFLDSLVRRVREY